MEHIGQIVLTVSIQVKENSLANMEVEEIGERLFHHSILPFPYDLAKVSQRLGSLTIPAVCVEAP